MSIKVKINGEDAELSEGLNLNDLAKMRELKGFFAIEKNLKIINKEDYEKAIKYCDNLICENMEKYRN